MRERTWQDLYPKIQVKLYLSDRLYLESLKDLALGLCHLSQTIFVFASVVNSRQGFEFQQQCLWRVCAGGSFS